MTTHTLRNDAAAPGHVFPGIRIHTIDIVQPPGIGIPISDMDVHQMMVTTALTTKSNAQITTNVRSEACSHVTRDALV